MWFSGHSASATGIYQDKSTSRASNHHFKFMVKSPSFSDITTEVHFYRDNYELKLDAKVSHHAKLGVMQHVRKEMQCNFV